MANILPDGTVIPSFLPMTDGSGSNKWKSPNDGEYGLKVGTIFKIYYPDDEKNIRKNRIEYDVKVAERIGRKGFNITVYKNCVCNDLFGGIADTLEYTLRPSDDPTIPNAMYQTGSRVLILCGNGDSNSGVIVGGVRNIRRGKTVSSEQGHFLSFEFNGINVGINKDGELTLTYKSKTDIQGTPQDLTSGGTFIKIDQTGSVEIHANDNTKVLVDKPNDTITVSANQVIKEDANQKYVANAPEMKIGGEGADEPVVLGNALVTFLNTQVIPKINGIISAMGTFMGGGGEFPDHIHSYSGGPWTGGPEIPGGGSISTPGLPSPAAPSGPAQLSDFVSTKKSYEK